MRRLLHWTTDNPFVVVAVTLLVAGFGIWSFLRLQVDAIPDITGVQVQINTTVPAFAPEEIERLVTLPIERVMAGQPGLSEMRSLTKTGLSQVTLIYEDGTDQFRARQLVTERLATVRDMLPSGSVPQLAPITTGLGEIWYYTLEWAQSPAGLDEQLQLMELYEAQEYIIKPMLRAIQGVADVNSNGGLERQFVIEPDLRRLTAAGVTPSELGHAIGANVENAGGGTITVNGQRFTLRTEARVANEDMIRALPVKFAGSVQPLTVADLATVTIGNAPREGAATANGRETVLGTVMMLVGQNSREVARRVDAQLPSLRAALPKGMILQVQYDRSELVERTVATVERNLGEGAFLVAVVLLVVMGNWRAALIVTSVIPLAFLMMITGMNIFGISGNLMSLGALDFGLLVDGAIVVAENAMRLMSEASMAKGGRLTARERRTITIEATSNVARPVFFGIAIVALVYVPVLSLGGVEGKLFQPMAEAVMLALGAALIITFTLVPVLCAWLLRSEGRKQHDHPDGNNATKSSPSHEIVHGHGFAGFVARGYIPVLDVALRYPAVLLCLAVGLLGATSVLFLTLGAQFTPRLDEGSITAMVYRPVGMSLDRSLAIERETEQEILRRFPQVTHTFSRIGTSAVATDPMPPNQNDLYIFYKPLDQWPQGPDMPRDKAELVAAIEKAGTALAPEQSFLFAQPIEMRFNEMLEGTRADLSVKIFGDDYDILEKLAAQARDELRSLPGTANVEFETADRTRSRVVEMDRDALVRLGLGTAEVNRAITSAIGGNEVGIITDGEHRHSIVVRLPESARADSRSIMALPLRVGATGLVPLERVARLREVRTVEPILHDNAKRRAALMVNLDTNDIEGYVAAARARLDSKLKLPESYRIEFGGQFRQLEAARARLMIVVPVTLLMIFTLVYSAVGSVRQAAIVYTGIPFAITGGVLALWLQGMPFSITAAIGFIALSGIAMLNGLVLVDHINALRRTLPLADAVRQAAIERLRPVLSTAMVAGIGFMPMAIATGAGAEVQRPLATVVIGGIISSTLLTLLLLPTVYRWAEQCSVGVWPPSPERRLAQTTNVLP
ncbi:MAG: efflux RND transporter permease subunit [Bradyrhizobiaceae bacterium]|nr:MAG: efflux RND transporter permease subunit [Bradyrhizobiaceae bacterium]